MNITLSADAELIRRARAYAQERHTTLNQMVRDYLENVVGGMAPEEVAERFGEIARSRPGRSPAGWKFDRNAIHRHDAGAQ